jgi:DNA primase large subunit
MKLVGYLDKNHYIITEIKKQIILKILFRNSHVCTFIRIGIVELKKSDEWRQQDVSLGWSQETEGQIINVMKKLIRNEINRREHNNESYETKWNTWYELMKLRAKICFITTSQREEDI